MNGALRIACCPPRTTHSPNAKRLRSALGKVLGTARMLKTPRAASGTTQETPLYAASAVATGTVRSPAAMTVERPHHPPIQNSGGLDWPYCAHARCRSCNARGRQASGGLSGARDEE